METRREQERGVALILALVILILMVGMVASYLTVSTSNLQLSASTHDTLEALYVAETGIARAFHELNADNLDAFSETGTTGVLQLVTDSYDNEKEVNRYEVEKSGTMVHVGDFSVLYGVNEADERITLLSRGRYNGVTRAIEVTLRKRPPTDTPDWSHYAILSDEPLRFSGNIGVVGDVHSNESIVINGASHSFEAVPGYSDDQGNPLYPGDVSACGTINGESDASNISINANAAQPGAREVGMPEFDLAKIIAAAEEAGLTVTEYSGNQTFNNQELTGVVVVEGNVNLRGEITGDAIIIATGTISVAANATLGTQGTTSLMIWAGDDIDFAGNCDIHGIAFASDTLKFHGNAHVEGSVISAGDGDDGATGEARVMGNPDIVYVPPDAGLSPFLNEIDPPKWELASWRECGALAPLTLAIGATEGTGDAGDSGAGDTGGSTGGGAGGSSGGNGNSGRNGNGNGNGHSH